jgi:hypothetical protein
MLHERQTFYYKIALCKGKNLKSNFEIQANLKFRKFEYGKGFNNF